jgi:hypothetical protein
MNNFSLTSLRRASSFSTQISKLSIELGFLAGLAVFESSTAERGRLAPILVLGGSVGGILESKGLATCYPCFRELGSSSLWFV